MKKMKTFFKGFSIAFALAAASLGCEKTQTAQLAKDGKACAQIVVAAKPTRAAMFAAYELKWHLDRITGGDFKIVKEDKIEAAQLLPIYVGESSKTRAKGADFKKQEWLVDVKKDSIELIGLDKADFGTVTYYNDEKGVRGTGWPGMFDAQGSMYATYDFLETLVGVRWLDSTDVGTMLPNDPNLAVKETLRRKEPFLKYRAHSGVPTRYNPLMWKKTEKGYDEYMDVAYSVNKKRERELQGELFQIRHRMGGESLPANHSFYYFYDKYWNKKAKGFVKFRPELFAKGYAEGTNPPQLCYTNPETIKQVIADVREYFDNPKIRKVWGENSFCLEPMDNSSFCRCETCVKEYEPERKNEKGSQSTHWYGFVNKVARAIKASHPGKKISTLAYFEHEGLPTGFKVEDNVVVYFCISANRRPFDKLLEAQIGRMREWRKAYPDQPLAMWLYNCFPSENAHNGNFHCFPGFFSQAAERQYKIFQELNVREGVFHCGFDGEVDNYIQLEKMIDPTRGVDELKDEFFAMYGKASKPLREFYETVEKRYCDKTLYKPGMGHQSAPVAWGILGTPDVMEKLGALMEEAEKLAQSDVEKRRVEIWKRSVWNYMKEGFDSFCVRMKAPQPTWSAPRVKDGGGDPKAADWKSMKSYPLRYYAAGSDELCGYAGAIRLGHDGRWFYLELTLTVPDTKTLVNLPAICSHDCWEILMARQKGQPYRCWFVAPDARMFAASWGEVNFRRGVSSEESGTPNYGAISVSDTSNGRDWIARFAFPLDKFLDGPIKPGDTFYLNAVNVMGNEHPEVRQWCKTHGGRFIMSTLTSHTSVHTTDRIGSVTLEK